MKKRRRFYQKGKLSKDVTKEDLQNENSQDQEGSPCGLSSKVAEPPVRAKVVGKDIPELKGKLTGMAFRVPRLVRVHVVYDGPISIVISLE